MELTIKKQDMDNVKMLLSTVDNDKIRVELNGVHIHKVDNDTVTLVSTNTKVLTKLTLNNIGSIPADATGKTYETTLLKDRLLFHSEITVRKFPNFEAAMPQNAGLITENLAFSKDQMPIVVYRLNQYNCVNYKLIEKLNGTFDVYQSTKDRPFLLKNENMEILLMPMIIR